MENKNSDGNTKATELPTKYDVEPTFQLKKGFDPNSSTQNYFLQRPTLFAVVCL